jgi:uncharacterized cupredoxin-like copper-binding protein
MKNTIKFIALGAAFTWTIAGFAAETPSKGPASAHSHSHGIDAVGKPGVAAQVTRTIAIDMADTMRFTPSQVEVTQGETIRFVVKNTGKLKHEFNLGTDKDLKAHAEVMKKFPEMEHDEPNIASVAPGGTGEVIWQFTKTGRISFACLHPGHFDAGMKGSVRVMTAATTDMATGEVKKIDKATQKITLKHGEIKSLDMPGMTMVFQVPDAQLLEAVKVGDKVLFNAERRDGAIVITTLRTSP